MRASVLLLTAAFTVGFMHSASAFDDRGHEIIATIAANYLTPAVRKQVDAMLKADTDPLTPHDIAGAATWADHYRDDGVAQHYADTANWHFASIYANRPNIPEACFGHTVLPAGAPASRGPENACIIDKIDQFRSELADKSTTPAERLLALKYILHLVGDIHAPLHVSDMHNQNGRIIQVVAGDKSITPGSLFGYWETAVVRRLGQRDEAAKALIAKISPADVALWSGQVTHFWALESHQIGTDYAYGTMLSRFEDGHFVIEPAELDRAQKLLGIQMSKAGVRLAALLNETLGGKSAAPAPVRTAAADPAGGHAIANAMCAVCHMVDAQGAKGPTFTTAPDFVAIANTGRMSQAVLISFLTGPHPTMPRLKLSEDQLRHITTYIMSLKQ